MLLLKIGIPQKFKLILLAILISSSPSLATSGEIFKWKDQQGNTHYSDIKPSNADAKSLSVRAGKSTNQASDPKERAKALGERKQKELEIAANNLQQKEQSAQNEKMCDDIRSNLKKIAEKSRIKIMDNGEYRYLSPEEINEKKAVFQKQLNEFCL